MAENESLESLAEEVAREVQILSSYLKAHSDYKPSFSQGRSNDFPKLREDIQESRRRLREAAKALHDLATGPAEHVKWLSWSYHDLSTLRWLVHFHIPEHIPVFGYIGYNELATVCNVEESHLRRILRYAMTNRLFEEPKPDHVGHTSFSAVLVTDPATRAWVDYACDETFPASMKLVEAHEKWGASQEPPHSAYCLAYGTGLPIFKYLAQPGFERRAERFGQLMGSFSATPGYDLQYTVAGYDWQSITGTVVDLGGSTGSTAVVLARRYHHLQFVVEDLPHVVAEAEKTLPEDLKDCIRFVGHDFFKPQPETVPNAEVYLVRQVLHDHPDKYARQIVEQVLPALTTGAKLVVVDTVVPPSGALSPTLEKPLRCLDMEMMQTFNGRERQLEDWKMLFASVVPRLEVSHITQPLGSALSIMTVEMQE